LLFAEEAAATCVLDFEGSDGETVEGPDEEEEGGEGEGGGARKWLDK
jgi:hypothetical protein